MKVRNIPISEDFYKGDIAFDEECFCDFERNERKSFPIKKALVSAVMAISIGMIINGVSSVAEQPEIHQAIEIEDSKWSEFDTSKVSSYFNILSSGTEYKMLEAMCSDGSKIYSTIQNSEVNMQHLYDENYGIAQGLQKFGSYMSINCINGVSDNTISLSVNYVSEADVIEFFNANSNDLCRFFTSHEVSEESLVRELFNLLDTYEISTSDTTIELQVEKVDGVYTIADDSTIYELLIDSYNDSIEEMTKQLSMHR